MLFNVPSTSTKRERDRELYIIIENLMISGVGPATCGRIYSGQQSKPVWEFLSVCGELFKSL